MKVIDNGSFKTLELETPGGQANYLASLKSDVPGDRRTWVRDPETNELNKYLSDNRLTAQFVVKAGDVYRNLKY